MTAAVYEQFLTETVADILDHMPLAERRTLWFQQDGAPPHFAIRVRDWLNAHFPGRWIGRRGPVEWPPRSPDLTPLDFFLWGHLKSVVYTNRPRTVQALRENIEHACAQITPCVLRRVAQTMQKRVAKCIQVNGAQFEHLLQ